MKKLLAVAFVAAILVMMNACGNKMSKSMYPYEMKYLTVMLEGSQKWSILDLETGDVVAKDAFKNMPSCVINDLFFVANDNGTYDYYNVADVKKPVNKEHYGSVTEFSAEGLAIAAKKGGNLCIIDKNCETVKDLGDSIVECSMFNRGLAVAHFNNNKYGYINTKGEVVVKPIYDQANPFMYSDLALTMKQRENDTIVDIKIIDKTGKETGEFNATMYIPVIMLFSNDVLQVQSKKNPDTLVCINSEAKEVDNPVATPEAVTKGGYDITSPDGTGLYMVKKGDKMGVVDKSGNIVVPVKYLQVIDVSVDRFLVCEKAGVFTLVDKKGKAVGKAKLAHANGSPSAIAEIGHVDPAIPATNILSQFDENGFVPVGKGATVASFAQVLQANQAEQYVGNNGLMLNKDLLVTFAGPIASKGAAGDVTFNMTTPVKVVTYNYNALPYANDTEEQIVKIMASNMGKAGFVSVGNNVFESENGTAVALGYKMGLVRVNYFFNKADAQPLPQEPRK